MRVPDVCDLQSHSRGDTTLVYFSRDNMDYIVEQGINLSVPYHSPLDNDFGKLGSDP
jgi:hypothetical protein